YHSRILDVGCGSGDFLKILQLVGFSQLFGVDAFIPEEITGKISIQKQDFLEYSNSQNFDLLMFHSSFEHMPDSYQVLRKINNLLSEKGHCLIRIPIKSDYIWNKYGINWFQIDAPRHFFIFTEKSFLDLAKSAGFKVENIVYESTASQFWASEQYIKDIPLNRPNSYAINPKASIFTTSQIQKYEALSQKLNQEQQGDMAGFVLAKSSNL
ncbi:MAG TPA: class I SAM-dependent methyltransferase, partial [Candidatus Lokiarchaeia archaeon]|nr:class I SAM-dependent methyltransferase [Candidatus Lokiarchaeia archaeon]